MRRPNIYFPIYFFDIYQLFINKKDFVFISKYDLMKKNDYDFDNNLLKNKQCLNK